MNLGLELLALMKRDLLIAYRRRSELANPMIFFALQGLLYPLGVTPNLDLLKNIAPGVVWISLVLVSAINLDALFRADAEDGSLDQYILSGLPLALVAFTKVWMHWIVSFLPLLMMAPILAFSLGMTTKGVVLLECGLWLGSPVVSFVGAVGASLTLCARRGGMLLPLLIMPLYIPIIIFATSSVTAGQAGLDVSGHFYLLGAIFVFSVVSAPFAISWALKISER